MRFSQVRAVGAAVEGKSVQRPMAWRLINWKRSTANGRLWASISYPRTSPRRWRSSRHLLGRLRVRATFSMSMVALRRHIHANFGILDFSILKSDRKRRSALTTRRNLDEEEN